MPTWVTRGDGPRLQVVTTPHKAALSVGVVRSRASDVGVRGLWLCPPHGEQGVGALVW